MEFCIGLGWFMAAIFAAAVLGAVICFIMFWTGDMQMYDLSEGSKNNE